jgi:hypothetical protein
LPAARDATPCSPFSLQHRAAAQADALLFPPPSLLITDGVIDPIPVYCHNLSAREVDEKKLKKNLAASC